MWIIEARCVDGYNETTLILSSTNASTMMGKRLELYIILFLIQLTGVFNKLFSVAENITACEGIKVLEPGNDHLK